MLDSKSTNEKSSLPPKGTQEGRTQPWKNFVDPNSPQCVEIIAAAPDQKFYRMGKAGDAPLVQYSRENGG